jgi:hypothetical protein
MEIAVLVAAKVVIGYTSLLIGGQGPFEAEKMTNAEKFTSPDKVRPHSILSIPKAPTPQYGSLKIVVLALAVCV